MKKKKQSTVRAVFDRHPVGQNLGLDFQSSDHFVQGLATNFIFIFFLFFPSFYFFSCVCFANGLDVLVCVCVCVCDTHTHTHTHTGNCDETFLALARACGWEDDLKKYKDRMAPQSQALFQ